MHHVPIEIIAGFHRQSRCTCERYDAKSGTQLAEHRQRHMALVKCAWSETNRPLYLYACRYLFFRQNVVADWIRIVNDLFAFLFL